MTAPDRWVGRRAERARADAERMRALGDLELARVHAAAQREAAADEAAERRALAAERAADRKAERKAQQRTARKNRRRAGTAGFRAAVAELLAGMPLLAGVVACVAPTIIATRGQYEFAHGPMDLGVLAWLFPAMLEGAAWLLAWRRYRAVRAGESVAWLTPGVWSLALVAAAMNVWHGATRSGGSLQVGVGYGLASLVGFALVELLARHERHADSARQRRRVGVARWLRFPRLAWAAWTRQVEMGPAGEAGEAWRQVWVDRFGVEPGSTRAQRRAGRRMVKSRDQIIRGDDLEWGSDVDDELLDALDVFVPPDLDPADEGEPDRPHVDDQPDQHDRPAYLDEWLSLDQRVELARATERAAGRPTGQQAIADLLGTTRHQVREVDDRRASTNGHHRQEQTS